MSAATETIARNFLSVNQLTQRYPSITPGMLRWWLFHRDQNGLARAVRKVGRRLLIDEGDFFDWLDKHREGVARYGD